ncbi:MAG: hypothetical protein KDD37_11485, partial [Bdellovibrionales bacterium]|nr:hypothetical protein [Bdellovibrionales bacterium]
PTTGLNHIDQDFCKEHQIQIISLKDKIHLPFLKTVTATSELAFGLLLSLVRNIAAANNDVYQSKAWNRDAFRGRELKSLRLGILGLGRLGLQMANYAKAFGMHVSAHDPHISESIFKEQQINQKSWDSLFSESDVISVHIDYNPNNHEIINKTSFSKMPKGSFFINTARGELVNESDLLEALKSKQLAGAALDVLQNETTTNFLEKSNLIAYGKTNSNLLISPHIGGCTLDSMMQTELYMAAYFTEKVLQ